MTNRKILKHKQKCVRITKSEQIVMVYFILITAVAATIVDFVGTKK